jgi:hypothetical protein
MVRPLLALVVAVSVLVGAPPAAAAPAPQQPGDEYQTRLLVWQQLVGYEVEPIAAAVLDRTEWPGTAVRQDWAERLVAVASMATRPAPGYEQVYRLEIQPVNDRLHALAAALRVDRREAALTALVALRGILRPAAPAETAALPTVPVPPLAFAPRSAEQYVTAAIAEAQANCYLYATRLGWRWESSLSPDEFLRGYWLQWLERAGEPGEAAAAAVEPTCEAIYARVQDTAADRGFAAVQRSGVVLPSVPTTLPAQTDVDLANRRYRDLVNGLALLLPDSFLCYLRASRNVGGLRIGPGDPCNNYIEETGTAACLETLLQLRSCLAGTWRDSYRNVVNWTPPAQYTRFHRELLATLSLANTAADNVLFAPPEGGRPLSAREQQDLARDARLLIAQALEQFNLAMLLYDPTFVAPY